MVLVFAALALTGAIAVLAATSPPSRPAISTTVVISEFRTRGPSGASDEFVELYNLTGAPINIGGWKINGSSNSGVISTRVTISNNTMIPAYGHFLATNSVGYSGMVQGDQSYGTGIADDGGVGLLDANSNIVDQVGMSTGSAYLEGTPLASFGTNVDRSHERKPGASSGSWQDTDNNANDFQETAPSLPQNLASSPVPPSGGTPNPTNTPGPASATLTSTPTPTAGGARYSVLFDNGHAETAGNADWIISTSQPDPLQENANPLVEGDWTGGISAWGVALQRTGRYSLKTSTAPLTYGNGTNPLDLTLFNALVLPEPNTLYSASEKTAVLNFVRNGGGLVMIADHDGSDRNSDGYDSLRIFNDLMNNNGVISDVFGITFDVLNIGSEDPNNDTPFADPVLQGPFGNATGTILRNGTTETLNPAHNANVRGLIYRVGYSNTGNTGVAVSRSLYGSGRVFAIGDSSAVDDGTCSPGNTCFNGWNDPAGTDSILFPNAVEWAASALPTGTVTTTPVTTSTNTPTNTATGTPTNTRTFTATPTATPTQPSGTASLKLYMLYASALATPQADEAVRIINVGTAPANIGGWQISNSSGGITMPPGATVAPGQKVWIANQATTFRTYFGFSPDYEYGADSDPAVPNATATAGYNFPDAGGAVQLRDGTGAVQDALVYGTGNTGTLGWSGAAVQYYTNSGFSSVGQVLYRKLDETTAQPVPDTDTKDDWAQDADASGNPPTPGRENDDINGRKILRPGWALTDPANEDMFSTKIYTETGVTTKFLVAPDNIYDPVRSLVLSATTAISIETYEWQAAPLVTDIINARNRGVRVTIAIDGDPTGGLDTDTLWAAQQWTDAGIPVYFFKGGINTPSNDYRFVNVHAKFMVVDNTWLTTGSENFSLTSMPSDPKGNGTRGHRGTFVITNAPNTVAYASRLFNHDVAPGVYPDLVLYPNPGIPTPPAGYTPTPMPDYTSYMPLKPSPLVVTEDERVEIVQSPDNELRDDSSLIGLVNTAGPGDEVMVRQQYERTYWQTGTTVGPNPRLQAYIAAAQRGASVRILLDAGFDDCTATNNSATVNYVLNQGLPNLQAKIGTPTADSIHDKVVLVRHGTVSTVHTSSINGSENASKANREFGLQIQSTAGYNYYKDVFEYDWTHAYISICFPTPTATATATLPGGATATYASTPTPGSPTATPTVPPVADHAVISEFRTHGPQGGNDEFIEIYNPTDAPIDVTGWKIYGSNSSGSTSARLTITANTVLLPHRHFLAVNTATGGYSGSVTGDGTYSVGVTDDGGIALLDLSNNIVDQVGMSSGSTYGEGTRLAPLTTNVDRSYERLAGGSLGSTRDTGDNSSDFRVLQPTDPQNMSSAPVPPVNTPTATPTFTDTPTATTTHTPTGTWTPTNTGTPTATGTATATSTCAPNADYFVAQTAGATIVAGTLDTGNHCDECLTTVFLPFTFNFYGIPFSTTAVGSNGTLQFSSNNTSGANTCLPATMDYAILPYWEDLNTNDFNCPSCGVFTSISGTIPSRILNIEWRACVMQGTSCLGSANFEVRLYEGLSRIDMIYGSVPDNGNAATVGVQQDTGTRLTQFECNSGGLLDGTQLTFTIPTCAPPTATATLTRTATATPTSSATLTLTVTPTATVGSPTTTPGPAMLVGHVTYQGIAQPGTRNQQAITLTICVGGATQNYVQSTDSQGFFTATLGLGAGNYNYKVKSYKSLANAGTLALAGGTTNQEFGTLRAGDTDNNNTVNTTDFNRVKGAFGTSSNPFTDFNNDGITNTSDFNVLKGNFGLSGQNITCP